jgi:ketosteroid isomerase-like protein
MAEAATREHPNAAAYRRTADAFRSGDTALVASLIAADVTWHVPGRHSLAGDVHGREALLLWLAELQARGFWLREVDVFGSDEHVCAISAMGARRPGIDVETRVVSVFRYRDGLQLERWLYPDDPDAWRRIFDD